MLSFLLLLLIVALVIGVIFWALGTIPGIPPVIRTLFLVVAVVVVAFWLISQLGGAGLGHLSAGRGCL